MKDALIKMPAAAKTLAVSPRTICNWMAAGVLSYVKMGKCVRFEPAELERFKASRTINPSI